MPMKFPKGFARRKSGGAALEEVDNPPDKSFRVLGRSDSGRKAFSHTYHHPSSSESLQDVTRARPGIINRGSGATNKSVSTVASGDGSGSSARFGSSSTLPSSTDGLGLDEQWSASNESTPDGYLTRRTHPAYHLSSSGRTLSTGANSTMAGGPPLGVVDNGRWDAMGRSQRSATTSSYTSTATPPKLDFGSASGGLEEDGFADLFANFGNETVSLTAEIDGKEDTIPRSSSNLAPTPPPKSYAGRGDFTPSPGDYFSAEEALSSPPLPRDSPRSTEGLIISSSPVAASRSFGLASPPMTRISQDRGLTGSFSTPNITTSVSRSPPRRNVAIPEVHQPQNDIGFAHKPGSEQIYDEDARVVMESVNAARALKRRSGSLSPNKELQNATRGKQYSYDRSELKASSSAAGGDSQAPKLSSFNTGVDPRAKPDISSKGIAMSNDISLFGSKDVDHDGVGMDETLHSSEATPRARKALPVREKQSAFASSSAVSDAPARQSQQSPFHGANKVMTPAQFENYRREQELLGASSDASSEESLDEDEDEAERNRQLAKQRRKQEAHLAVYRQQMMKVTGDNAPQGTASSGLSRTSTPAALSASLSSIDLSGNNLGGSRGPSDDEDEDIPLAILAAHGFPNKNRPPSSLRNSKSSPAINASGRASPAPSRPSSIAGDIPAPGRVLPPFARNLPQDPYYGASIVNPAIRETPSFPHGGSGASVYGAGPANLLAGGLVGVIAEEERAKAMRRGSPNAYAFTNQNASLAGPPAQMPGMGRSMTMNDIQLAGGIMPMVGQGPMMVPSAEQAHLQMAQMTQMMQMQMQMQWMQQMMQVQGLSNTQQLPPHFQMPVPQGYLGVPNGMQRPMTMSSMPSTPQSHQRTTSMLDTNPPFWNQPNSRETASMLPPNGYAPSIAPSERSNVGMPSRYRPVSTAQYHQGVNMSSRASTYTNGATEGWNDKLGGTPTIRRINTPSQFGGGSDDDDEQGWEEMKKKREAKKSTWRSKKDADRIPLSDVTYAVSP